MAPPIAAIRLNQASARMYAALSGLTSWASPCPTSCSSARGATVAQMSPAVTPSTALPARAAANAASRPFTARSYPSAPLRFDGVYVGQDRGDRVEAGLVPGALGRDQCVADAGFGQLAQVSQQGKGAGLGIFAQVKAGGDGLFDFGEVAADLRAVLAEHAELAGEVVAELRALDVEQVAGVGVLRHHPQRLALSAAADQDWRVRPLHRVRRIERADQLIVPALIRALVAAPHLMGDLQQFLEPLEALGERRERDAEALGLEDPAHVRARAGRRDVPRRARPTPKIARPPVITSSVVTALTSTPGGR